MSLGDELIVNGDFDTDTDWTKGERWSIDTEGGLALFNSPTFPFGSLLAPEVPVVLEAEKTYQVSVTLLIQAGSGQIELSTGPVITTSGSHTFTVTGIAGNFSIEGSNTASAFVTYIDNVSVREVLPDEGGGPVMQQLYEQYYER